MDSDLIGNVTDDACVRILSDDLDDVKLIAPVVAWLCWKEAGNALMFTTSFSLLMSKVEHYRKYELTVSLVVQPKRATWLARIEE